MQFQKSPQRQSNYWSVKDLISIKDKYRESDKKLRSNIALFSKISNVEIKLCSDKRVVLMTILALDCVTVNIFALFKWCKKYYWILQATEYC